MGNVVLIEGKRTPFLKSGTDFIDLMSYQLGRQSIVGLLQATGIDPQIIDSVTLGTVISNVKTSNVAREAAITAGIPNTTPCHTVTQACISANRAIASAANTIALGQAAVCIAGGTESVSDTPIGLKKDMRKKLFKAQKMKGVGDTVNFVRSLSPGDLVPEKPAVAEYITNRTMGQDCEIMVNRIGVSREEQDEFAARSHQLAHQAWEDGHLEKEVCSVDVPPNFSPVFGDNGIRGDSTAESLATLKPAFDKKFGSLTAGNSSFLTDGAAAVLLMDEKKAKSLKMKAKARIVDFVFTGQDLYNELLLGPAYATAKLLEKNKLSLDGIDVFEIHEAFAGQVLANLKCLKSTEFAKNQLNAKKAVGEVPMEKLNLWGGSLSIGHPFGATGARLMNTAANRLHQEKGKYAVIAACAAGAHGHAMLIEKI